MILQLHFDLHEQVFLVSIDSPYFSCRNFADGAAFFHVQPPDETVCPATNGQAGSDALTQEPVIS